MLLSVPIVFINVLNEIAALLLATRAEFLRVFDGPQLDTLALLFYRLHGQGLNVARIFWGLWLFPFGVLVMRSGFIPQLPGALLMGAGTGYVCSASVTVLLPRPAAPVGQGAGILELGERPIILWLLISGGRESEAPGRKAP